MIKICIVHYNTPLLTECLIKSINKFTPNSEIFIFDNSDKEPFTYRQENIVYFDNTKGQYINFNEYLNQFPSSKNSRAKKGGWASLKHCYSIQKCIDLINDNFILLDSDVLLTRDITPLANDDYIYVGQFMPSNSKYTCRVYPFVLFLNVKMMKQHGVSFYDEKRMFGMNINSITEKYDTGASFYEDTKKYPKLNINFSIYIKHYAAGSYYYIYPNKALTPEQWLKQNKKYWETKMPNKKVIYTCITGNYDSLMAQPQIDGYDYICFTDSAKPNEPWQVMPMPECVKGLTPVKQQRWVKLHAHELLKKYEYSIWIDANVSVLKDPSSLIDEAYSVQIPAHPARNCIYDEKAACLRIKKDKEEIMEPQMQRYRAEGYPKNNGLVQSNIMFRKHNEEDCIRLMETWWAEIEKGSHRDQLSFNYALWKNKDAKFKYMDKKTCESIYFKWLKRHGVHSSPLVSKTNLPKQSLIKNPLPKPKDQENKIVKTFLSLR